MKKSGVGLLLFVPLFLAACQGSETSAPQPAPPGAQVAPPANNAVAVTKPAEGKTGKAIQESMQRSAQRHAELAAGLSRKVGNAPAGAPAAEPAGKAAAQAAKTTIAVKKVETAASAHKPAASAPLAKPRQEAAAAPAPAIGDAAKGARIARKCQACHNFNARRKVGPGLAGVYGRKAGIMPDTNYSAALKNGGWSWDAAHLAAWLCNTKKAIKDFTGDAHAKTKMPPQRVCDPARQADLIAFLKTL